MFSELAPILKTTKITITIEARPDDDIAVTIYPQRATETENPALAIPLQLVGRPDELDEHITTTLQQYVGQRETTRSTLTEVAAALATAAAMAKAASSKPKPSNAKPAPEAPAPPPQETSATVTAREEFGTPAESELDV